MKVSYGEGVAIHTGSESCIGARKGAGEALTGVRTGQPLSREIETPPRKRWLLRGADAVEISGRQNWKRRYRETLVGSARSETLRGYVRQQGGVSGSGSQRSCTTFMTLSGCVRHTSRSGAKRLQGPTARRGGTTERSCKGILRISLSESSEEHIEPSLCVGRTSPRWASRVSFGRSECRCWKIRLFSAPRWRFLTRSTRRTL